MGELTSITAGYVRRLEASRNTEALRLVQDLKDGRISESDFIAQAARFGSITRSDAGGALTRSARLHASSGVHSVGGYDPRGMAFLGDLRTSDLSTRSRGSDVSLFESNDFVV